MDGVAGYSGWRWIFILEGLATIVVAVIAKFIVVDWPETARFLTEDERALLLRRLAEDQGEARMDRLDKKSLRRAFSDPKIYLGYVPVSSRLRSQINKELMATLDEDPSCTLALSTPATQSPSLPPRSSTS
jgi:hypothetical protein